MNRALRVLRSRLWRTPLCRVKFKWWSLQNWCKGYKFGPICRCRDCGHTTPYHYDHCPQRAEPF